MSSSFMKADCRKFTPNIFNKTKCSNCFHQKEEHTAEALESNRVTRNISKCGYLFVAPGRDFSNPINRTKRWQRRWFILYDDGELSYSLDEHPDTVPQASIDMNKAVDVTDAEETTGNSYSIAITVPDAVHFVKGTCREEAKWWKDVLSVFTRTKGRHKRNATFPGSQGSTIMQQTLNCIESSDCKSRFNSIHADPAIVHSTNSTWFSIKDEIYPSREITISVQTSDASKIADISQEYSDSQSGTEKSYRNHQPATSFSPPTRDKLNSEGRLKTRRLMSKDKRSLKFNKTLAEEMRPFHDENSANCYSENLTSLLNGRTHDIREEVSDSRNNMARRLLFESEKTKRDEKLKDIADSLTRPRSLRLTKVELACPERRSLNQIKPTRDGEISDEDKDPISLESAPTAESDEVGAIKEKSVRGDPDGCGLDLILQRYSPSSELRVDLPAEDLLNIKKGWLLKQGSGQEWTKHWFVLRGVALMYYRDPAAEDKGILDGVMDLSSVNSVVEVQAQRNYGFQAISWDDKRYILSAATAGIRRNWMAAIRKASGLTESFEMSSLNVNEKLESDAEAPCTEVKISQFLKSSHSSSRNAYSDAGPQRNGNAQFPDSPLVAVTQYDDSCRSSSIVPRSHSCQYVEGFLRKANNHLSERAAVKRSSSAQSLLPEFYQGLPESDYRVQAVEKDSWNQGPTPLPPSPPLNRTPISKVKERAKIQTIRSRVYNKRSKSSPPCARKNIIDISCADDPVCEEKRDEPKNRSAILYKVDKHVKEIDELKGQLTLALCERSTAEKELCRLRQRKSEANQQVEELLRSLKIAEDELKVKTQELENFESLKQSYSALVKEHEGMLKSCRESAINDGWKEMYRQLKEEYARDKGAWEMKLADVTSMLHVTTERCEMLARELTTNEEIVEALKGELTNLSERLMRGLEENEGLYGRMRELEGRCLSSSRERGRSVDSLSDLTNIDLDIDLDALDKERIIEEYEELKGRFEKAVQEIRVMKKELRESHASYDDLELTVISLRQDSKRREENGKAQAALMASRIEDLTLKLSASEKQFRLLKQKIVKSESREKRRSLSLKGKESFHIGKETEEKLGELEAKINALENNYSAVIKPAKNNSTEENRNLEASKTHRFRRKSLETAGTSEPMKLLVRMFSLERKIVQASEILGGQLKASKNADVNILVEGNDNLTKLVGKIKECKSIISSLKTVAVQQSSKFVISLETALSEMNEIVIQHACSASTSTGNDSIKSLNCAEQIIKKLENLLKLKITELSERRRILSENNELDEQAKLMLLAEKLAYESILIRRIRQTLEESSSQGQAWRLPISSSEIQDIKTLMTTVQRKVEGENINLAVSSFDVLSKSAAESLYLEGEVVKNPAKHVDLVLESIELNVDLEELLEKKKAVEEMVDVYKSQKMEEIAHSLALEEFNRMKVSDETRNREIVEDRRVQEAWSFAREVLNKELIQFEISHIATRCMLAYESGNDKRPETQLTFIAERYKRQEEFLQKIEESLRAMISRTIGELFEEYEKASARFRWEKNDECMKSLRGDENKCKKTMEDLFGVLSQMTIIDAKIRTLVHEQSRLLCADKNSVTHDVFGRENLTELDLESRFIYFYFKFSAECLQLTEHMETDSKETVSAMNALKGCADQVQRLREVLRLPEPTTIDLRLPSKAFTIRDVCGKLLLDLENVANHIRGELPCRQCCLLKEALQNMEIHHAEDIRAMKLCHEKEMKELKGDLETQKNSLVCQHEMEQAQLIEKTRRLERRLGTLDAEYSQQMDNLRTAYNKTISADVENKDENSEDSIRQRYQAEIEQLRTLCEKGLSAVDNSHRRIIAELEEKHRQELAAAAAEKEQALAEETQATLAALDAMRKAHETEVQKEINKFKAEYLKKMQSNHDIGALHKEHEVEMEEIKKEILSLSEKYSVKCVESASLEEQLIHVNKQLLQAQEHITLLDARNKQLRAHLLSGDFESPDRTKNECCKDPKSL